MVWKTLTMLMRVRMHTRLNSNIDTFIPRIIFPIINELTIRVIVPMNAVKTWAKLYLNIVGLLGLKLSEIARIVFLFSGIVFLIPKLFLQGGERLTGLNIFQFDCPVLIFHTFIVRNYPGTGKEVLTKDGIRNQKASRYHSMFEPSYRALSDTCGRRLRLVWALFGRIQASSRDR